MPLWTSYIRTRAYRIPPLPLFQPYRVGKPWRHPWLLQSYSTASSASRPDDTHAWPLPSTESHAGCHELKSQVDDSREQAGLPREVPATPESSAVLLGSAQEPKPAQRRQLRSALRKRCRAVRKGAADARDTVNVDRYVPPLKAAGRRKRPKFKAVSYSSKPGPNTLPPPDWATAKHSAWQFRRAWSVEFERIVYAATRFEAKRLVPHEFVPTLDIRAAEWTADVLRQLPQGRRSNALPSTIDMHALPNAKHESRHYVWAQVALWLSAYDLSHLRAFLLATHVDPYPPALFVSDCLRRLGSDLHANAAPDRIRRVQQIPTAVTILGERGVQRRLRLPGSFIRRLLLHCGVRNAFRLYSAIRRHRIFITGWTYAHFVDYFAKRDNYVKALFALWPTSRRVNVDSWVFRTLCSTLLRRSMTQPDGLRETLKIVSTIVEMGVKLDEPICDIIMLNAVEAGDLRTAFDVYHSLMERGLAPTERTFTILLKACKSNIDDADMLNEVIRDAIRNVNVRRSNLVASNILHCLALHHSKKNPTDALKILIDAYAQFYDLEPLKRLQLPMPTATPPPPGTEPVMRASPHALGLIIAASVKHRTNPNDILPFYLRWRTLVEAGDPDLAQLATTDYVANTFLQAFIQSPSGMVRAARVIKDMQTPLPPTAGVQQAAPTVQSWNIFLHGFSRHGKMELADQVRAYMRSKGICEDVTTFNTLIHGYARAQDGEKALEMLRRGNENGVVWNKWSATAAKPLRDGRVKARMSALRSERMMDFTDELKQGLEERVEVQELEELERERRSRRSRKEGEVDRTNASNGFGDSAGDLAEGEGYMPF